MRLGVGIMRNADGFGLHKGLEIGRNFLLLRHRLVATFAVFQVHDVGLVVRQRDAGGLPRNEMTEMPRPYPLRLPVHETDL